MVLTALACVEIGGLYMLHLAWETFRSGADIQDDFSRSGFVSGLGYPVKH